PAAAAVRAQQHGIGRRHAIRRSGRFAALAGQLRESAICHRYRGGSGAQRHGQILTDWLRDDSGPDLRSWRSGMIYLCCNEKRKSAVLLNSATLNAIDHLEVLDREAIPIPSPRQQTLFLHCLRALPVITPTNNTITANNVLIEGGESIVDIKV